MSTCGLVVLIALILIQIEAFDSVKLPRKTAVILENPDENLTTDGLIERFGYPAETHRVTTKDGYIIQIFRIPHGKVDARRYQVSPPVLLQHGLLSSSDDWVINFENQSLGFMLADAGFDVWISNVRGNKYGLEHVPPTPSHHDFFQFSWDDMAEHDLPVVIDYILNATNYKDLQYVGHSMGTTLGFAMLSSDIEYNSKVRNFHALAPVGTLAHIRTGIKYLAPFVEDIKVLLDLLGDEDFLPSNKLIKLLAKDCNSSVEVLCEEIIFLLCGYDPAELNMTRLPVYLAHTPAGTSVMTVVHYAQEINSGYFRRYDYGFIGNYERYGQFTPPEYELEKITTPVTLYWSDNDLLADPEDVNELYRRLPSCVDKHKVGGPKFSHLDFIWGVDDASLLNEYLINKLERY